MALEGGTGGWGKAGKECKGMAAGGLNLRELQILKSIGCFSVFWLMLKGGGISRMPERGPAVKDSHSGFGGGGAWMPLNQSWVAPNPECRVMLAIRKMHARNENKIYITGCLTSILILCYCKDVHRLNSLLKGQYGHRSNSYSKQIGGGIIARFPANYC